MEPYKQPYDKSWVHGVTFWAESSVVAEGFERTVERGIDSADFCEKVMLSEYGQLVLTNRKLIELVAWTYFLNGIERTLHPKKGPTYSSEIMWYAGYLYYYWTISRSVLPEDIYKLMPIEELAERYGFIIPRAGSL